MKQEMQKFRHGDHVKIAENLGPSMSHFRSGCEAIVIGSYYDQYGGDQERNSKIYTLHIKGAGECSWYYESQLELIAENQKELLQKWKDEREAEIKMKGDIDWIFANGKEAAERTHGATVETLAKHLGIDNLWGNHGEGMSYYVNASCVMAVARPFLLAGDKAGFLELASKKSLQAADYHVSH